MAYPQTRPPGGLLPQEQLEYYQEDYYEEPQQMQRPPPNQGQQRPPPNHGQQRPMNQRPPPVRNYGNPPPQAMGGQMGPGPGGPGRGGYGGEGRGGGGPPPNPQRMGSGRPPPQQQYMGDGPYSGPRRHDMPIEEGMMNMNLGGGQQGGPPQQRRGPPPPNGMGRPPPPQGQGDMFGQMGGPPPRGPPQNYPPQNSQRQPPQIQGPPRNYGPPQQPPQQGYQRQGPPPPVRNYGGVPQQDNWSGDQYDQQYQGRGQQFGNGRPPLQRMGPGSPPQQLPQRSMTMPARGPDYMSPQQQAPQNQQGRMLPPHDPNRFQGPQRGYGQPPPMEHNVPPAGYQGAPGPPPVLPANHGYDYHEDVFDSYYDEPGQYDGPNEPQYYPDDRRQSEGFPPQGPPAPPAATQIEGFDPRWEAPQPNSNAAFAAQAHRSRSQPNLKGSGELRNSGASGFSQTGGMPAEMPGDIPALPSPRSSSFPMQSELPPVLRVKTPAPAPGQRPAPPHNEQFPPQMPNGQQYPPQQIQNGQQFPPQQIQNGQQFPPQQIQNGQQFPPQQIQNGQQFPPQQIQNGQQFPPQQIQNGQQFPLQQMQNGQQFPPQYFPQQMPNGQQFPPRMRSADPYHPSPPQSIRSSNPDALPEHPPPIRPGLMQQDQPPMNLGHPPPVRQYTPRQSMDSRVQQAPPPKGPLTAAELEKTIQLAKANSSDQALQLQLAKMYIEAASVLADEGGRADAKTTKKNRENYIFDAHKIIKKLANGSHPYPDAMFFLAQCYGDGALGLAPDRERAFSLYHSAAKLNHAPSAYRTAVCCEIGAGTKKDPIKAVQWYKKAASLGDTGAMYKLGIILLKGLLGQQKSTRDALSWLKRAADQADPDNPHALHELGLLYERTDGREPSIIPDQNYALELFTKAAELGYSPSQFRLGHAYEFGALGCPIDPRRSIMWYSRAASKGEPDSELALSGWYLTGAEGVLEQSDTEAYLWARKAAEKGLAKAEYAVGHLTEAGFGVPPNLEEAKRWYYKAASQGFQKAQERLKELKKGGPAAQQKSRERLSRSNVRRDDDCVIM